MRIWAVWSMIWIIWTFWTFHTQMRVEVRRLRPLSCLSAKYGARRLAEHKRYGYDLCDVALCCSFLEYLFVWQPTRKALEELADSATFEQRQTSRLPQFPVFVLS